MSLDSGTYFIRSHFSGDYHYVGNPSPGTDSLIISIYDIDSSEPSFPNGTAIVSVLYQGDDVYTFKILEQTDGSVYSIGYDPSDARAIWIQTPDITGLEWSVRPHADSTKVTTYDITLIDNDSGPKLFWAVDVDSQLSLRAIATSEDNVQLSWEFLPDSGEDEISVRPRTGGWDRVY